VTVRVVVRRCPAGRDERHEAHHLLRRTVAAMMRVQPGAVAVDHDAAGRPQVRGTGEHLDVSVSHTRGMVALALSAQGPVGVDVEAVRPIPALALSRRWFGRTEADWVAHQPPHRAVGAFLWLWTAKEAVGKLHGCGLRGGGLRRPVPVPGPRSWDRSPEPWQPVPGDPGVAVRRGYLAGFVLAVAVRQLLDPLTSDNLVDCWTRQDYAA
jgi:4'-phosphopantetheinyl transferase